MRVYNKKVKIYAIYRGDEFVDVGTKKELMQKHNLSSDTFNFYNTKTYHNRIASRKDSKAFIIYKVGEEDEN